MKKDKFKPGAIVEDDTGTLWVVWGTKHVSCAHWPGLINKDAEHEYVMVFVPGGSVTVKWAEELKVSEPKT